MLKSADNVSENFFLFHACVGPAFWHNLSTSNST